MHNASMVVGSTVTLTSKDQTLQQASGLLCTPQITGATKQQTHSWPPYITVLLMLRGLDIPPDVYSGDTAARL